MLSRIMKCAKSMFKWTMDSRMDDSVMVSTMDTTNDGVNMETNGGDGSMNDGSNEDGDYTIIYESDDGEEAEVDYYDTDSWAEDLFAVQLHKAMKDIDRKEAQLIEAGWAPTEEKVDKVRRLRAEVNLCMLQVEDLEAIIKKKKLQIDDLCARLDEAEKELAWAEHRQPAQFTNTSTEAEEEARRAILEDL